MQVQPVVNLVCRAKAVDLTPDVSEANKKKWASQKCTLAEYRNAGGFPNITGDATGGSTGGSQNTGGNTGGSTGGNEGGGGGFESGGD